ncbi:hypothetical protein GOODEAATRI_023116, partial [Goodea atripinnis]
KDGFLSFQTSKYRLHYYETPSGLKFVMNTDLSVSNARDTLQHIYSNVLRTKVLTLEAGTEPAEFWYWFCLSVLSLFQLYVELVVKNPLCPSSQTLDSELFGTRLDSFIRSLPYYSPRAA